MLPRAATHDLRHTDDALHRWAGTAKLLWAQLARTRALGVAAEMAFWLFLALVPLAAVAAYVAARLALHDWSLAAPLMQAFPSDTAHVIERELGRVAAWNGGAVTPLAAGFFLWLASTGIHSIFDGFEAQTGVVRPWLVKRAIALACCIVLSLACGVAAIAGTWLASAAHRLQADAEWASWLVRNVGTAVFGIGALYLAVAGLFRAGIPLRVRRTIPLVPGTILVVVLHIVLGLGYRLYLSTLGDGSAYLAGLAVVGVTMTSLYLSSAAILTGLALNQVLAGRMRP